MSVRTGEPVPAGRPDWRGSPAVPSSAWSPLRQPLFRALWIAAVVSNIGTWMQSVGGAWLMISLTPSTTLVGLVQSATSVPVFIVGLPAGALADIVDRRRLMLFTQAWMLVAAAGLAALTMLGWTTPWILLGVTFALGFGAALYGPAWEAVQPELVPRSEVPAAVALGGVSVNVARAVGPALGGGIIALAPRAEPATVRRSAGGWHHDRPVRGCNVDTRVLAQSRSSGPAPAGRRGRLDRTDGRPVGQFARPGG